MNHSQRAKVFLNDAERADWQDKTLWGVRMKRDLAANAVPEWEQLREMASGIKQNVLSNLDEYLLNFEKNALNNGVIVHWASDANEFNKTLYNIIQSHQAVRIVKSKSMLTEECHLNEFLEKKGIEVVDTDLGERIIQFRKEPPSHIVLPAIHLKKEEIGSLFHEKLNTDAGASDPKYLTEAAREHLREKFLKAEIAITGVNFAIAESGAIVVCTNEGNADMGVHAAPVQIHCMGIEKIIPRNEDLGIFLRLLARNATGQPITTYSSHFLKPRPGSEMHVVIVDNGRSVHLGNNTHKDSLKCIRCGACMNTCPVYRRSGGYSYQYVIPGPIGSILAPLNGHDKHTDLPFASTLCGSCANVCPVKIDIHHQLYRWRQELSDKQNLFNPKKIVFRMLAFVLAHHAIYDFSGFLMRSVLRLIPGNMLNSIHPWGKGRYLPQSPKQSFKTWYKSKNQENGKR